MSARPGQRLRRTYMAALGAVAALSLTAQALIQHALQQRRTDSRVVNLAGRQRMLSQRITKAALLLERSDSRAELRQAHDDWSSVHTGLRDGDPELGLPPTTDPELQVQYEALEPHARALEDGYRRVVDGDPDGLEALLDAEKAYLEAMDAVVFAYDAQAAADVAWLQRTEAIVFGLTLLVLLAEALLVFEPAIRTLRAQLKELAEKRAELELRNGQLKSTVAELRQANRLKSDFMGRMSHEFRTPLFAVIGYCDLLELNGRLHPDDLDHLQRARASGQRLLGLIEDLLSLSRLEAQRESLDLRSVALGAIAQEVCESLRPLATRGVELITELSADGQVTTDEGKVRQILTNLLGNALKFTREGEVRVSLRAKDGSWVLSVQDTGPGIPEEERVKIFEAFHQVDGSSSRHHGGTGLGLAISAQLADMLHATLSLESEPGRGSTFSLKVPESIEHPALPNPPEEPASAPRTTGPVVWVVSARPPEWLESLEALPVEISAQPLLPATVAAARDAKPAVIVVDASEDPIGGLAFLAALRNAEALSGTAVVLIPDDERPEPFHQALSIRPAETLAKPIDEEGLCQAVLRCLGRGGEVLVVDDDPDARILVARTLEQRGYSVQVSGSGAEALERLRDAEALPAGVVLDLHMPDMSGYEVLAHLKRDEHLRDLPVVVFTATDPNPEQRALLRSVLVCFKSQGCAGLAEAIQEACNTLPRPSDPPPNSAPRSLGAQPPGGDP